MKISAQQARKLGEHLNVDFEKTPLKWWRKGLLVELEHGYINPSTNVTNDDLIMTGKIAKAHIDEYPNYYQKLSQMEKRLAKQWNK